jgi:AcrR family transcriptional regulator
MNEAKANILNAASEIFLEGGIHALSVRAIAKRAGVSTIGIYSHFKGKQGILDAMYIEGFNRVTAALLDHEPSTEPKQIVLSAARNYLRTANEFPAHHQLIFSTGLIDFEPTQEAANAGIKAFETLTEVVSCLLPETAILEAKQQNALEVWSLLQGFVSFKDHPVSRLLSLSDWDPIIIPALSKQIDAIMMANEDYK